MGRSTPQLFHYGPLTGYLLALDGAPELLPLVSQLPAAMPVVWCDSARRHPVTGRYSMVGFDPWLTLIAYGDRVEQRTSDGITRWHTSPLEALRYVWRHYRTTSFTSQPWMRGVGLMGFLGYEVNRWIEPRLCQGAPGQPAISPDLLWWGMGGVVLVDHLEQRGWILSVLDPYTSPAVSHRQARERLDRTVAMLETSLPLMAAELSLGEVTLEATSSKAQFEAMVETVLDAVRAGEIFQANVSQRFTAPWVGDDALSLYQALRAINPSPFACYLSGEGMAVASGSPERLVRVEGQRVETRPIAGTKSRGRTPVEDVIKSWELLLSDKERAEHVMLVDLERNDLGRVCEPGSVHVEELMTLEEYSHVIHIVSQVCGTLRGAIDPVEVIEALFPGGTITGCPKVRCMEILQALEPVPRGLYTGSLGYLGFDGTMDLNIAIRTMVIHHRYLSFHVGAGVVADSLPEREYAETLSKAAALMEALRAVGVGHAQER